MDAINIVGVSATKKLSAEKIPAEECGPYTGWCPMVPNGSNLSKNIQKFSTVLLAFKKF